ncbi:MAG: hypothetical protein DI604_29590 [Delftia acidovorans]|nr:MAG: hypothetical protein DI604_29590 [Delftia acidovorans]
MQLIQYAPTTAKVYMRLLVIIPPCINKFYILDLRAEKSLMACAVAQGHGSGQINTLGFCIGGALLASALAIAAARGETTAASVILLTAMPDFSDMGELGPNGANGCARQRPGRGTQSARQCRISRHRACTRPLCQSQGGLSWHHPTFAFNTHQKGDSHVRRYRHRFSRSHRRGQVWRLARQDLGPRAGQHRHPGGTCARQAHWRPGR